MKQTAVVVAIIAWFNLAVWAGAEVPSVTQASFQAEMRLAGTAADRDSKVQHWKTAISYRPNDPNNITIEYKIAVALSQETDLPHGQGLHRDEGLTYFRKIADSYDHMHYYSREPGDSIDSPQFMAPRAAVHAASLLWGRLGAPEDARRYLNLAMKDIEATYRKRIDDWTNEPAPQTEEPEGLGGEGKAQARLALWKQRQKAAAAGEVLGDQEMVVVKEAVRQFGYTYGEQHPYEVAGVMRQIIKQFPGTPMARLAQHHIDQAAILTTREVDKAIDQNLEDLAPENARLESVGKQAAGSRPAGQTISSPVANASPASSARLPIWSWWAIVAFATATIGCCVFLRRKHHALPAIGSSIAQDRANT